MKKLTTLLLALVACAGTTFAWDYTRVQIGDLYYNLDTANKRAEVTSQNSVPPFWTTSITSGAIPNYVDYENVEYRVNSIAAFAFFGCDAMTFISIPWGVTFIGDRAFEGCTAVTAIEVAPLNEVYSSEDGVLFNEARTILLKYPAGRQGDYTIPNSVTDIKTYAFDECSGLTAVTFGINVTDIYEFAFMNCSALTSVTNYAGTPQTITANTFCGTNLSQCTLYVPQTLINSYKSADIWKTFGAITGIPSGECGADGNNLSWMIKDSTLIITGSGAMANWNSNTVPWAAHRAEISKVSFPNGITTIGDYAFYQFTAMDAVQIPQGVTSIGYSAFSGCTGLKKLELPFGVNTISNAAFSGCTELISVKIPTTVSLIGEYVFADCAGLKYFTDYASTPQSIAGNVFTGVDKANVFLYVPQEAQSTYASAPVWSEFATIYGERAGNCGAQGNNLFWSLASNGGTLYIAGSGDMADYPHREPWADYVNEIYDVSLPDGITKIGAGAFWNCYRVTSITIPDSVTSIGDGAFRSCESLATITIGQNVSSIGAEVFDNCYALSSITVRANNSSFRSSDGVLFNRKKTQLILYPRAKQGAYTIPSSVTDIAYGAFRSCGELTELSMPDGITSLPEYAFAGCNKLASVTLPGNLTSIPDEAFYECSSLDSLTIPASVTTIGELAFKNCTTLSAITIPENVTRIKNLAFANCYVIQSLVIPDKVTRIGEGAFSYCSGATSLTIGKAVTTIGDGAFEHCNNLNTIITWATTPQAIAEDVFPEGIRLSCNLYVPLASLNAYRTADVWKTFGRTYGMATGSCGAEGDNLTWTFLHNGELTFTGSGAMADWDNPEDVPWSAYGAQITIINIPEGVTSIGQNAFRSCTAFRHMIIPASVATIGAHALVGCSTMTGIEVAEPNPAYVSLNGVLYSKDRSTLITYPANRDAAAYAVRENTTTIADQAFYGTRHLTELSFPESLTTIGAEAFAYSTGLSSFEIPATITAIAPYTFAGCSNLISVKIHSGVESIGNNAFYGCSALKSIYNNAVTPQTIQSSVFEGDQQHPAVNKDACTLFVPENAIETYQAASVWQDFTVKPSGNCVIYYVGEDDQPLKNEEVILSAPQAPEITGFRFVEWQVLEGSLTDGITIRAVYKADIPSSTPAVYTNPTNPAQKLIKNGNVYILTEDKTYTITGKRVN